MGGHARPYSKHGRAMPVHNSNFDFYAYIYSEQTKVFNTTKLMCTNCVIYCLSAKLGSKKEIEICKYIK